MKRIQRSIIIKYTITTFIYRVERFFLSNLYKRCRVKNMSIPYNKVSLRTRVQRDSEGGNKDRVRLPIIRHHRVEQEKKLLSSDSYIICAIIIIARFWAAFFHEMTTYIFIFLCVSLCIVFPLLNSSKLALTDLF